MTVNQEGALHVCLLCVLADKVRGADALGFQMHNSTTESAEHPLGSEKAFRVLANCWFV